MADHILAVDTYGSQRVKHPQTQQMVSAYKIGYTTAATAILLTLYGTKAHDVSSKQASYRYIHFDSEVVIRHGYLLVKVTPNELAQAERIAREQHRAGAFLWREQHWLELPNNRQPDYTEPLSRSGPNFDPTGFRPVSPSTGTRESAIEGIIAEKTQRSADDQVWWWLKGNTYPHRDLLKQQGARFSSKRKQWYYVGAELPHAIEQLVNASSESSNQVDQITAAEPSPPAMSPELERQILAALERDDAKAKEVVSTLQASPLIPSPLEIAPPLMDEKPPAVRIIKPTSFPSDGEALDVIQTAIRNAKTESTPAYNVIAPAHSTSRCVRISQSYCGELTGSISGQVYCYGYAIHDGVCVYVNMGGPRTSVEAIRAKLSKGDIVTVVPDDAPAIELTPGEGNSGMYTDFLQTIPEARFTSLILLHDWVVNPNYGGAATTFILRVSEAQAKAKLKQHVAQLVNIPVFDIWMEFLWTVGQAALLVRPTHSAGDIDLLTVCA